LRDYGIGDYLRIIEYGIIQGIFDKRKNIVYYIYRWLGPWMGFWLDEMGFKASV
jgi:hypothetical protein